jgi:hypothetical protein
MILLAFSRLTQLNRYFKITILGIIISISIWIFFFHWTGIHQIAIKRNVFTGSIEIDTVAGIDFSSPWVQVSRIDTRPHRLCIDCECRALNCKLVEFRKEGWKDFVDREGFRYYWLDNRLSFNSGSKQEYRGMDWILRGYAYDEQSHSFLKITKE